MAIEPVVLHLRHGPFWNFSYVVGFPGGAALVVDPAWDVPGIIATASRHRMRITHAAVTHGHYDHAHGLGELVAATGADVLVGSADLHLLAESFRGEAVGVGHEQVLNVGELAVTFLHTPGHTPGSVCIAAGEHLFTGDTLHTGGRGRHGHHDGAATQLDDSLRTVLQRLPGAMRVHPGHDAGPASSCRLEQALARAPLGFRPMDEPHGGERRERHHQ